MRWKVVLIGAVLFSVYTLLNYYIGVRGASVVRLTAGYEGLAVYWLVFWVIVYLYMGARFFSRFLPTPVDRWLIHAGAYWMAAMVYFLMAVIGIDLMRIIFRGMKIQLPEWLISETGIRNLGLGIIVMIIFLIIVGSINARRPRVTRYHLEMPVVLKDRPGQITVALVSDIHLGTIIRTGHLKRLVNKINNLDPDVILFAGDIIDENVNHFIDENMDEWFLKLNPPMGKYAVLGNHEYFGGHTEEIVHHLENSGITVLRDEVIMVSDLFYLAGREDVVSSRFTSQERKALSQILEKAEDPQIPVILMDHQPKTWNEAVENGIWLQVSGHTHRGQLFPFEWITERLFPEDWGLTENENHFLLVSSGYGTWGPPVRIGNYPEIAIIKIEY